MTPGASHGPPYTPPAPMVISMYVGAQGGFGRMARGGANVAGLVEIMEQQPGIQVEAFETLKQLCSSKGNLGRRRGLRRRRGEE